VMCLLEDREQNWVTGPVIAQWRPALLRELFKYR